MGVADDSAEVIKVLNRRFEIVQALSEEPREKRSLVEAVDCSRSTVDRATRELEEYGLIVRVDGALELTPTAELILRDFERVRERIPGLREAQQVLSRLPPELDVDPAFLKNGTVVTAGKPNPVAPLRRVLELTDHVGAIHGIFSTVHPRAVERYRDRLADDEFRAELITEPITYRHLHSAYGQAFEAMERSDDLSLFLLDREIEFCLGTFETDGERITVLGAYGPSHDLVGVLLDDSEPAFEWGMETYRRLRSEAVPVEEWGTAVEQTP